MTGRKIATKETQEGCLSFSITRFSERFSSLKNCRSLPKRLFRQAGEAPDSIRGLSWFAGLLFQKRIGVHRLPLLGHGEVQMRLLSGLCCGGISHGADDLPGGYRVALRHIGLRLEV